MKEEKKDAAAAAPSKHRTRAKRPRRTWRDVLRYIAHQRATPEAIALGLAIGLIITFTPTVGIQIPLALLFATIFNANRWTAVLPVWLTNMLTVPPVYAFTYWVGSHFVPDADRNPLAVMRSLAKRVNRHEFYLLHLHFKEFFETSRDLFLPMLIGGLIVGGVFAAVAYPLTLVWIRRRRARRSQHIRRRAFDLSILRGRKRAAAADGEDRNPAAEPPSAAADRN